MHNSPGFWTIITIHAYNEMPWATILALPVVQKTCQSFNVETGDGELTTSWG